VRLSDRHRLPTHLLQAFDFQAKKRVKPGLELMPFQAEGASLLAQSRRAMLVWDPGVGKTPTSVRACLLASAARILVFCPPIGTAVWRQHFKDWSDIEDIRVADARNMHGFADGTGVRIIPFSRARSEASVITAATKIGRWDAVIIDEAHYLKSSSAQRTRAVYGDRIDLKGSPLKNAEHIWCLTGTPLLNHPAEFWTHLHALSPSTIRPLFTGVSLDAMTEDQFLQRFCLTQQTPYGVRIIGGRNTHELAQRIKPFIDRKRLKDVILDMPELRIVNHPLPADMKIEKSLRVELANAIDDFGDADTVDDDTLLSMVQAGSVAFSTVRRLIGRAKIEGVSELVADELDDARDDKVIVFAHHREVIDGLALRLKPYSPLVIHGGTPMKQRDTAIDQFQNDDHRRLIILAIEAAGEVITLHASHNVIVAEPSPVPAKNHQAIARAHRKGQRHPVLARFVLLPGTLDARLMSIVARKTRDIAQIVDGEAPSAEKQHAFPDTE
jgi:SWI/SNF-related matrix-associated actin-dependent regulator 1 of chromatin subfamily A